MNIKLAIDHPSCDGFGVPQSLVDLAPPRVTYWISVANQTSEAVRDQRAERAGRRKHLPIPPRDFGQDRPAIRSFPLEIPEWKLPGTQYAVIEPILHFDDPSTLAAVKPENLRDSRTLVSLARSKSEQFTTDRLLDRPDFELGRALPLGFADRVFSLAVINVQVFNKRRD